MSPHMRVSGEKATDERRRQRVLGRQRVRGEWDRRPPAARASRSPRGASHLQYVEALWPRTDVVRIHGVLIGGAGPRAPFRCAMATLEEPVATQRPHVRRRLHVSVTGRVCVASRKLSPLSAAY